MGILYLSHFNVADENSMLLVVGSSSKLIKERLFVCSAHFDITDKNRNFSFDLSIPPLVALKFPLAQIFLQEAETRNLIPDVSLKDIPRVIVRIIVFQETWQREIQQRRSSSNFTHLSFVRS